MVDLKNFFEPKSIAVIGVSRNPSKVGHVTFKNILDGGFKGKVYPVNWKAEELLGHKVYPTILKVPGKVDLVIIAVPAKYVLGMVKECNKKGIKDVLIVTAGFSETGNKKLEDKLRDYLNRNKMRSIGVNCLGIFNAYENLDTLFLPRYRLRRPDKGGISFVCQSGAVGSATLDYGTEQGLKFAKFVSYGNATQIDESDLLEYLGNDKQTKVICLYVEGIRDGEKFFRTVNKVTRKKPIIALKGGLSERGSKATQSHTASLAGKKEVYFGVFRQTNIIKADSLEEMFHIASLVGKGVKFRGNRVMIITNGGGFGIISTDGIVDSKHLKMAEFSPKISKKLKETFSSNVSVGNPLDLVADATTEAYEIALDACIKDKNIDAILCISLYQTPLLTTNVVEIISGAHRRTKKPIISVSTGAEFTKNLAEALRDTGVPVFNFPESAIKAMDKLAGYQLRKGK